MPPATTMSEAASKQLLAAYGLITPDERVVADPDAAASAASDIGYPVVVKLVGDTIAHKTERGLVRLSLGDADSVVAGARPSCSPRRVPTTGRWRCSWRR